MAKPELYGRPRQHVEASWRPTDWKVSEPTLGRALAGEYGLELAGQELLRYFVIDLDVGDGHKRAAVSSPSVVTGLGIDDFLGEHGTAGGRPAATARRASNRQTIERRARPIIDRICAAFPGVEFAEIETPNGMHLVFLLDEPVPVAHAHALGTRVLLAIGSPTDCEIFPLTSGRTARLPLTGGSRLVRAGRALARRRRSDNVEALLSMPPSNPSAFGNASTSARATRAQPTTARAAPPPAPAPAGESEQDRDLRERLGRKLSGSEWSRTILELHERGIPDNGSYDATRKLAFFLVRAAGLSLPLATEFFDRLLERDNHRATHTATASGRKQLRAVFRSCCRHQAKKSGNVLGRLARAELWRLIYEVLGRRVRALSPTRPVVRYNAKYDGQKQGSKAA